MRIIHLLLTAYFVFVSIQGNLGGRSSSRNKACRNSKKSSNWKLRLLRRIAEQLPEIKLLSLKKASTKNYLRQDKLGSIVQEDNARIGHVPKIQCPQQEDSELLACPTPDKNGNFYCLDDRDLCDRTINCPNGEDENLTMCMFHKWAGTLFDLLTKGLNDIQAELRTVKTRFRQFRY